MMLTPKQCSHMTPMPMASCDLMPRPHMTQKGHVTPDFNSLNVRNAVVSFMMLLISCGTDASANGIK